MKQVAQKRRASDAGSVHIEIGTRVLVYFEDDGWFGGVVAEQSAPGLFTVAFDDGTREEQVAIDEMRLEEVGTASKHARLFVVAVRMQ